MVEGAPPTRGVVVSGASGVIGQYITRAIPDQVFAVSRDVRPSQSHVCWMQRDEVLRSVMRSIDCVLHLEVKQHVFSPTPRDLDEFTVVNVLGTQLWLDWCTASGVTKFVYFSSIKAVQPLATGITTELADGPGESPYGASKWAAERRVRAWVNADLSRSALIIRPSVVYGSWNVGNVGAMVTAIERNRFFLVGKNDNVKSLVSVKNLVAAVTHLISRMKPGHCEIYNVVDRQSYSVRQIDRLIRTRLGKSGNSPTLPLAVAQSAAKFGDAFHRLSGRQFPINTQRLDALLENTHFSCQRLLDTGFVHPQATEEGIPEMVDWYAANR